MAVKLSPHETSDNFVQVLKSSNLHFCLQETPHSAYITIRKKFVKEAFVKVDDEDNTEKSLHNLKTAYDDLEHEFEKSQYTIKTLEEKVKKTEETLSESNKFKAEKNAFTKTVHTSEKKQVKAKRTAPKEPVTEEN